MNRLWRLMRPVMRVFESRVTTIYHTSRRPLTDEEHKRLASAWKKMDEAFAELSDIGK